MGYEVIEWRLSVTLDAHAGDAERRDDALWGELHGALMAVLALPQYAHMHTVEVPEPTSLPPAVRWRVVLALVEAAERLVAGERVDGYVDEMDTTEAIAAVRERLEWHAFQHQGEGTGSVRTIDGGPLTCNDWLVHTRRRTGPAT